MAQDVQPVRKEIERAVTVPLNTHQLDALTSFVFNSGLGSFKQSHLLRDLNAGRYHAVPSDLMAWTKAGGQTLSGLVKRRRAEGALWNGESQSGSK